MGRVILKDREIKLATQVEVVKALVFPIVRPTIQSGNLDDEKSRQEEKNCIRDVVFVAGAKSVVDGERNECRAYCCLKTSSQNGYPTGIKVGGYVVREEGGMENDVMLGVMSGKRRRGSPRTRWKDNVNNIKGPA